MPILEGNKKKLSNSNQQRVVSVVNEVTDTQFWLKFGGKFEFIGSPKGHFGLVFGCKLLKGTEKFLPQPGFEPRLLDYYSSVLTIMLQSVLYIVDIYILILY